MGFPFAPPNNSLDRSYAFWQDGWTSDELDKIIELCETLPKRPGEVGGGSVNHKIRNSYVAWVPFPYDDGRFAWIWNRISEQISVVNQQYFRFDLWGFVDNLQYTVYDSTDGPQHYDWHIDNTGAGKPPRKLSLTLQLTDPLEYEGGELWIHGVTKANIRKERGLVSVFPSYTLHRVTPVTSGVRRSLVGWASGPEFR